jgi:hypothetical protein
MNTYVMKSSLAELVFAPYQGDYVVRKPAEIIFSAETHKMAIKHAEDWFNGHRGLLHDGTRYLPSLPQVFLRQEEFIGNLGV